MTNNRHSYAALAATSVLLSFTAQIGEAADAYPTRPVRMVNPYTPGGTVDLVCRALATRLTEVWGQQLIVDNRPGAGTNIGTEIVVRAQPDGYTLLCNTGTIATNPSFYPNLPFNPLKDLTALVLVVQTPNVLTVHSSVPARSVRELIDLARAKPGQLTFGSSGTGSSTHLSLALFTALAKVDLIHVPYKGGGPLIADLVGGQVNGTFNPISSVFPHVKTGRVRALAVTSAARSEFAPDTPTVAEAGVPDYEAIVWYAVFAPRALPARLVEKWNGEINRQLKLPELRERFFAAGMSPMGGTPREADEYFARETARWSKLIRDAKISVQQ